MLIPTAQYHSALAIEKNVIGNLVKRLIQINKYQFHWLSEIQPVVAVISVFKGNESA